MQDPYFLMTRGFKNVVERGVTLGYQINIRIPYYRGVFLSLIDNLSLSVDEQRIPPEQITLSVCGRSFTFAEMQQAENVRWDYGAPAALRVARSGGLSPGIHTIEVGMLVRKAYLPPEDPEHLYEFSYRGGQYHPFTEPPTVVRRRMTLVQ
jgi:hypothetical protein